MGNPQFKTMEVLELLACYAQTIDELLSRGIVRSANSPVSDYAEHLVCNALSLEAAPPSTQGFDATDNKGVRYEIKARRETQRSKPRRFSAIRDLEGNHFDFLVAVLFAEDFMVKRAGILPIALVHRLAFYQQHVNGWILPLRDNLWSHQDVRDITKNLRDEQMKGGDQ